MSSEKKTGNSKKGPALIAVLIAALLSGGGIYAKKNNIDIKSLLGMGDTPPAEVQKGNPGEAPLHVTDMSKAGNSVSGV
ncbi:MAG: hypothetical protein J5855_09710, partial [Mailhella sp.]|nr:hypothetical protein [Mailhella sp.]